MHSFFDEGSFRTRFGRFIDATLDQGFLALGVTLKTTQPPSHPHPTTQGTHPIRPHLEAPRDPDADADRDQQHAHEDVEGKHVEP
jgi:hypothetical protein